MNLRTKVRAVRGRPSGKVTLTLFLVFALLLAACGGDDDETSTGGTGGTETTAASGDDGDGGDGGGPSGDPVKIGAIVTISGPAASIGEDQRTGMEMAVEELNEANGILGRPVELIVKDDGGDPTQAAQVMRELVDQENVDLILGPTLSSPTLAAADVATRAEKVMITTASADAVGDAATYPFILRTSPRSALQAETFVDFMESAGYTKAALLAVNNALGTSVVEAVTSAIEGTDITITATEFFETGAVDLTSQVTKLENSGAEVLIAVSTATPDQVASVRARNQLAWDVPVLGFSTMAVPQVTEGVGGPDAMENVFAGQNYKPLVDPGPEMEEWLEKLRDRLGQRPLTRDVGQVVTGYDQVMMAADTADNIGSFDAQEFIDYRIENVYEGLKASYEYDEERHDGEGLDDLVFVIASSLDDGTFTEAPID